MKAIVLSGGGAKGSYQMGFWKAIRKLNIKYDIVTGTSIGAINGALMVQNSYKEAMKLWKKISYNGILKDEIDVDEITKEYVKYALKGGMEPTNLHEMMRNIIDEEKIRNSSLRFGLVTVKFPSLKKVEIKKEDIKEGQLCDYLMASSACFPFFEMKDIDGQNYMDGGFYDNLPVNFAVELGATEIIAVDLQAIGFKRSLKSKGIEIKYISPKSDTGSILCFESGRAIRNIRYGYNDTMKAFNELDGDKFTFKKNHLDKNYNKHKIKFINIIKENLNNADKSIKSILSIGIIKGILNDSDNEIYEVFNKTIEKLGKSFELDDSLIYSIHKYNKILKNKITEYDNEIIKIYNKIENKDKELYDFMVLDIDDYLAAVYLYMLKKQRFML